ncbi:cuticle protein 16.5-like [Schistocerca serialis cubense]|uniref:cuticle protein 16.5-like n=1 Tax=Schistocerca serialis cubense TaxID=2023355 RepID=UPI00214EA91E|nr:cuticle protein 16.5-like [Schistocerca serialis cubense]
MIKLVLVLAATACCVSAAPKAGLAPLAYSAPLVAAAPAAYAAPAPAVVTAHSSQYIAQNFNGLAVAPAAPVVAAAYHAAPFVAAAYHAAPAILG